MTDMTTDKEGFDLGPDVKFYPSVAGHKMTPERAREIYDTDGSCMSFEGWEAKGFLAGIEYEREAAKGLVTALERIAWGIVKTKFETHTEHRILSHLQVESIAEKALTAYKSRKGQPS